MAIDYQIEVPAQSSIYKKNIEPNDSRIIKVKFSVPETGVNEETGILLIIDGFGAGSETSVYKKMRRTFADEYNLVTVQCDYFGNEFMHGRHDLLISNAETPEFKDSLKSLFSKKEIEKLYKTGCFNFDVFTELGQGKSLEIAGHANISDECESNFNDMGPQQALDNITAVIHVMNILFDNDYTINTNKIIIYGQSHGAYIGYLCNAFAPHLFSLIIDNSAWIVPSYFFGNRMVCYHIEDVAVRASYDYLAKKIVDDMQIIDLSYLYSKFNNNCNVVSYHGDEDLLVSHLTKREFLDQLDHVYYYEIDKNKIDDVFKSNQHALDVDLLEMFRLTMKNLSFDFGKSTDIILERVEIQTDKYRYEVDYSNVVPYLSKYQL